jgi:hypothetical protein
VLDDYGPDVLSGPDRHRRQLPRVSAAPGLVVEVASDGFVGAVTRCSEATVTLRDRRGRERQFGLHPGAFLVDDRPVILLPPPRAAAEPAAPAVTASGSLAVDDAPARVARASRILVEGVHDAELVEHVWGDDLRHEGIVVEVLHGADDLAEVVRAFGPGPTRRLGVLLDHLVEGSKESRLAARARHPHVLVTGHPYVDVWEAVRPAAVGIDAWPRVPMGEDWKQGVATRLGYDDPTALWRTVRASVRGWRDLEQPMIAAVESLIDFVSAGR